MVDQWMWWQPNTAKYPTRATNPTRSDAWIRNPGFPASADLFCFEIGIETCM